ncbi:hypothetical protein GQ43DRAFT_434836 [Delitschia confertaspora ATCC 74209]|uniref:Uncharacterized protein n=1 Tax=Delitschia confertaspora ATCC 74209 TaxID=1513339 RepID=A0A9P4MS93_9PLEO|nr:hypothetical protein GQ43DRAFT_434836 [Delitschia confertaspora ATCC 74209]
MEVDSSARASHAAQPPPPSLPDPVHHRTHLQQSQHNPPLHHHHHAPLQPVDTNRRPAPSQSPAIPSPALPSPSAPLQPQHGPPPNPPNQTLPSPVQKPINDAPYSTHPTATKDGVSLSNRTRELPPIVNSPVESHRPNGQFYPRSPQEVQLDAIERLQTQISLNSGTLRVHSRDLEGFRDILLRQEHALRREFNEQLQAQLQYQSGELKRVDDAVGRLQQEMRAIREVLESVSREVHTARETHAGSALELMANNLATVSHKANEVDDLKLQLEIMKSKLQRFEDAAASAPGPASLTRTPSAAHPLPSPHEPSLHSTQSSHPVPNYHSTPSTVSHVSTPIHPPMLGSFHNASTPEVPHRPAPVQTTQSGWVTVNSSVKRGHPNGMESPGDGLPQPADSPKRLKLAPIEPRMMLSSQSHPTHQPQVIYNHMEKEDSESRGRPSLPPSQSHSWESLPEASATPANAFIPYHTQEGPSDEGWHKESQRMAEQRSPRGRGRGGGGTRGRPRKSYPTNVELDTPDWEKEGWQEGAPSQLDPEGVYNANNPRSGRGILRRGSGGGGSASRASHPTNSGSRAASLGLQGVTTGPNVSMTVDQYAHTKKTRTKPIRNADGILIRKDGRPDMRSQSSAANLRKVHARKEEQKSAERSFTPTAVGQYSTRTPDAGAQTPSPTYGLRSAATATGSLTAEHERVMSKVFPQGLKQSRESHDYAKQLFGADQGGLPHTKGQGRQQGEPSVQQIKREHQEEQRQVTKALDSQSPGNMTGTEEDVDMDRVDHEDEGTSPAGQSEASGHEQYHDVVAPEARPPESANS